LGSFAFYAQELRPPRLKFDYSLASATETDARRGIRIHGPYDKNLFPNSNIKATILTDSRSGDTAKDFAERFKNGLEGYPGFSNLMRVGIGGVDNTEIVQSKDDAADFDRKLQQVASANPELAFVIIDKYSGQRLYSKIKAKLLGSGVPCQVVNRQTLEKAADQVQWILPNIALSSYAKAGGTPWVIDATDRAEVVLGMSRAVDRQKNALVGFTTIFKENGDYILYHSKSPVRQWEEYEASLEGLVQESVQEYEAIHGMPNSLVIHFHKRTGDREVRAVKAAIDGLGLEIPYALLHLNSDSSFFPFDASAANRAVPQGTQVNLGKRQALLVSSVAYGGEPAVVEITMDRQSTMSFDEFPRLIQQVYDFSFVNWRGFGSKAIPVTIYYPYLIARVMVELEDTTQWNGIVSNAKLLDKAWFL